VTDLSPDANQVRARFGWIAIFNFAFAVVLIAVGVANALTKFLGHGWFFTVVPLVLGVVCLRSASHVWTLRDRVAAGRDRLAAMDEPTRRARKRRANRIVFFQLVIMGAISIVGAFVGGWLGFLVALLAMLIALELFAFLVKLLIGRRRVQARSEE
jgi:uncharacterized membrane protein YfcA